MSRLGQIPSGDPVIFEPNGPGSFPRVEIQRIDDYQPGKSILDHYAVETFASANAIPETFELETWRDVNDRLTAIYGEAWAKKSGGAKRLTAKDLRIKET